MITKKDSSSNPLSIVYRLLSTERGVALVGALVIVLAVTILVGGTFFVVTHSTVMSGAGKRFSTAAEAADGAIEIAKAAIGLIASGEPSSSLPIGDADPPCLSDAVLFNDGVPCAIALTLPANDFFSKFSATVSITRLYASSIPGNRIEFPRSANGPPSTAIYYRINAIVAGPGGTRAETSALYRYVF